MIKVLFTSLGCDKNLVDSEVMLEILYNSGFALTDDENEAAAAVINTCGFIKDAIEESIEHILKTAALKNTGNLKALIVTGCLVEKYKNEIFNEIPEVDAIVGTVDYTAIAGVINKVLLGEKVTAISDNNQSIDEHTAENRRLSGVSHVAHLKIAEGCDNCCTYCTIPQIRGRYRSRKMESLVREAENLAGKGVRELSLVAQDTALYGKDIYGASCLHKLLRELSKTDDIKRLRILYAYPEHITKELIAEMANNPKVCHYIDIPVQHSNDRILSMMGRRGSNEALRDVIAQLRDAMPDIALRTTLIVGFPGETEEEFASLMRFIEEIRFDKLGVFEYSREDNTPAAKMSNQISAKTKRARKDACLKLQKKISEEKLKEKIGKRFEVIVDGSINGVYSARTYADCYETDGSVFFEADYEILSGEFADVIITGSSAYDLYGRIIT